MLLGAGYIGTLIHENVKIVTGENQRLVKHRE